MTYVIGVDIGGTFTDACVIAEEGTIAATKTLSTPPDYGAGVLTVLSDLAERMRLDVSDLLAEADYICHGTTAGLNALVTGNVPPVGFLTTRGHRDSIVVMNVAGRHAGLGPEAIQDVLHTHKPEPLVPRRLVREIDERVDRDGAVVVALDEDQVRRAVRELVALGVEAIAVSFLWSFANPAHERAARRILEEEAPGLYVGLSSDLNPRIREYPRSTTTIMSTQVGPVVRAYLDPLHARLRELGFLGQLLIMQGSGGTIGAQDAAAHAITTVGSVLTGGIVGCVTLGGQLGHRDIVSTDMGGTTFLVGMVVDGAPVTTTTAVINQHEVSVPMVEITTIGSGGGAVAWVDAGGNLKVGPRSAGARPGPACYAQGGTEPTITDADVVLGIIDPGYFLGGRKRLDIGLAREAIRTGVAEPLGLSVEDSAAAIFEIANSQTADVLRQVVLNNGHDPRDFVLYSYGGAGPVHCANYAAELGARQILVPLGPTAATFSAFGLCAADVVISAERSRPCNVPVPAAELNAVFAELEAEVTERMKDQDLAFSDITLSREVDARYLLQLAEVTTPVPPGTLGDEDVAAVVTDFERRYEKLFGEGTGFAAAGVQLITFRVYATGHLGRTPTIPTIPVAAGPPPVKGRRRVCLSVRQGWADTAIYDYGALRAGHTITGPAVVEAPTTTVPVPAGMGATVDPLGNLVINLEDGD
ncbi:hydantoinase/oxoprolinase family protein [Actinomadura macra]|uniref:hydantoinase/oxoprolinase family protein n=1 Tax=Actinomadura macra TaxID=46164 RepID=UPI00082E222C|nr:hydantoinase/oxoprolinase family protein [Actinomadura macra]